MSGEPRIYSSAKLSYDFQASAETIHDQRMKEVFLQQGQKLNSSHPDNRWEAIDAMKLIGRQPLETVHEFRVASLQVLEQVAQKDPDEGVKDMASRTLNILRGVEEQTAEPA